MTTDMSQLVRDVAKLVKVDVLNEAESVLQELAAESFQKEQFQDGTPQEKWKSRKNEVDKKRRERRALLVKTGDGQRSIETSQQGNKVSIGTDKVGRNGSIPYMQVHNEGLRAGRGKGFKMEQRQHISKPGQENKELTKRVGKFLDKKMDDINS